MAQPSLPSITWAAARCRNLLLAWICTECFHIRTKLGLNVAQRWKPQQVQLAEFVFDCWKVGLSAIKSWANLNFFSIRPLWYFFIFSWAAATKPQRPHWKWTGTGCSVVSACHHQDSMQDSVRLIVTAFYTFIHPSRAHPDTIVHSFWLRNLTCSELDWMKHLWGEWKTSSRNRTRLNAN